MIESTHLRAPLVGAAAMALAFSVGVVHLFADSSAPLYDWLAMLNAPIYGAFVFVFARAWRSLARTRRPSGDGDEALGDLARALELTGGFAVLVIVTLGLMAIGIPVAMMTH